MANILIIDDEPSIRTTLSNILKDEGYQTVACESVLAMSASLAIPLPQI